MTRLRWKGSLRAQKEYEAAVSAHPPRRKGGRKQKAKKQSTVPAPARWSGESYADYLGSNWWKSKRKEKLRSVRGRCEGCGGPASEIHHKHYRTLGRERNRDLEALCRSCHKHRHYSVLEADNHLRAISRPIV